MKSLMDKLIRFIKWILPYWKWWPWNWWQTNSIFGPKNSEDK